LFPPRLSSMLRIGEEQGNVAGVLLGLGAYFQEEFETALKRFITLLEPAVIVGTGAVIAVMVLSMFSAIFSINDIQF
ncbi:MAG: type II secretion system F family protein, partial [Desulfovibrionaceae bacterium]|nr:type II secretion system F family protein [Desulfovibrionaceae bacterium]